MDWLMKESPPWVTHRTLLDLLERDRGDDEVASSRGEITQSMAIERLLDSRTSAGGWEGDFLSAGSQHQGDTISVLQVLADFGLTVEDQRVAEACEFVLGFQDDSGNFRITREDSHTYICYAADALRSLSVLGLLKDERVQLGYDYIVKTQRLDGGWMHSKSAQTGERREHVPSCPHSTLNVLWALSENPALRESQEAVDASKVPLQHFADRTRPYGWGIGTTFMKLKYPFTWYGLLKFVHVLSRFEFLKGDPRLGNAIELVLHKASHDGRWTPGSVYTFWKEFDFGQKKAPSTWLTVLSLGAIKRFYS